MRLQANCLERLPRSVQWGVLVAVSLALTAALEATGLPAALMLGPMGAAILFRLGGGAARIPRVPYLGAQAIVGSMIAGAITPSIMTSLARGWPLFLPIIVATVAASSVLGWAMSRWQVLPGTTGVWGSSPGAASAMVVMAEAFGADPQLVAFMQYLRVVCVAGLASLVARFTVSAGPARPAIDWLPPIHWPTLGATLALATLGATLGRALRIPSGALLVPMVAGAALHALGLLNIELPPWLLAAAYALLGWNIGLGFTRRVLAHASRALGPTFLSIVLLIGFSGCLALVLTRLLGIDPLTAYLATSPGGMDSVAIIAASSNADVSFVMALQTARFFLVVLLGPPLASFVARRMRDGEPAPTKERTEGYPCSRP